MDSPINNRLDIPFLIASPGAYYVTHRGISNQNTVYVGPEWLPPTVLIAFPLLIVIMVIWGWRA